MTLLPQTAPTSRPAAAAAAPTTAAGSNRPTTVPPKALATSLLAMPAVARVPQTAVGPTLGPVATANTAPAPLSAGGRRGGAATTITLAEEYPRATKQVGTVVDPFAAPKAVASKTAAPKATAVVSSKTAVAAAAAAPAAVVSPATPAALGSLSDHGADVINDLSCGIV
jgi:hypothetical protein